MRSIAYYNGRFADRSEISIPLTDRCIYFGDGVYDAAIGKNGKIFLLDEHVTRLLCNAKRLSIPHPTYYELYELLNKCAAMTDLCEFFIYFQLTAKCDIRRHSSVGLDSYNLLITIDEFEISGRKKFLSLITHEDLRYQYCDIKTLNLLPSVIAATSADNAGCDEAVFHRGKTVTECSHSNVSILKNGTLYTHPTTNHILPGITRKHLLCACDALELPYRERSFTLDELFSADEILVTSTTKLCKRANVINSIRVGEKDPKNANKLCDYLYNEYENFVN